MFNSTKDFVKGVDTLISHVETEESRNEFFKTGVKRYSGNTEFEKEFREHMSKIVIPSMSNSKRFLYNSTIVSLYGFLENFLESLVIEFVENLSNKCNSYLSLPEPIRKKHLDASIELLQKKRRNRNLNSEEKDSVSRKIIGNMHSCVQLSDKFKLNEEAFSLHTANFRYDAIHQLFAKIGVDGAPQKSLEKRILIETLTKKHSIEESCGQKALISLLKSELDDLAQRRNEISHGNINPTIESIGLFKERAVLIKSFGQAIDDVLVDFYYEFVYSTTPKISLGLPNNVLVSKNLFEFSNGRNNQKNDLGNIALRDYVFAFNKLSKPRLIYGSIVAIKQNRQAMTEIKFPSAEEFSIQVDFNVTDRMKNCHLYISKKNEVEHGNMSAIPGAASNGCLASL